MCISIHSCLLRFILTTSFEEEVFSRLFTAEWEAGETLCSYIPSTLQDIFNDFSEWLSEYWFSKFIKDIITLVTGMYVTSLLRRCETPNFRFKNELAAANQVDRDLESLVLFFEKYAEELRAGGLRPKPDSVKGAVVDELEPIANLMGMIRAPHFSAAEADARSLYDKFKGDGLKIVLATISFNPSWSKAEKVRRNRRHCSIYLF